MARTPRTRSLGARQLRSTSCPVLSNCSKTRTEAKQKEMPLASEKKDWKGATCSVCLEHPHDAVLLLCSSHNKGCRPYMCGTNYHQSNCLEQFKNAYAKEKSTSDDSMAIDAGVSIAPPTWPVGKQPQTMELMCPLCRGEVKGWTVVEPAREYLNRKRRTCVHDGCSFIGTYEELCKHVNLKHPSSKPREVDPALADKWKKFESERERQDAISTIRSLNPGAMIMGDYVLELNGSSDSNLYSDGEFFDSDDSIDSDTSLDGSGRGFFSREFFRRAHRRFGERFAQRNYTTIPVGASSVERGDAIRARLGRRMGLSAAIGIGRPRRHRHTGGQRRSGSHAR